MTPFESSRSEPGRRWGALAGVVVLSVCLGGAAAGAADAEPQAAATNELMMGGCGGVYFLAGPGDLTVEVVKRDRNRRDTRSDLRAILAGPDRRVLQEAVLPDDGRPVGSGMGPAQRCRLTARAARPGVYVLNVTVSRDPHGTEVVWGFRSNCPKYVVETARGHRDARHEEPIVLASPDRPADVCFEPRAGAFSLEVSGLPKGAAAPQVFDATGAPVASLAAGAGRASNTFAAVRQRAATPWRLHLASAQAVVQGDGLTRWDGHDLHPDMACWTPDPEAWFPFAENRWVLTPYSRTSYGRPGETVSVELRVRNDAPRERTIDLSVEFEGAAWPVRLSAAQVKLGARKSATVTATCTVPAEGLSRECHVRATPSDGSGFTTFSTLIVKAGEPPAAKALPLPIELKPYRHENDLFGHAPDIPSDGQLYFDLHNRPYMVTAAGLATLRDGRWVVTRPPGVSGTLCSKIAFDRDNALYVLARTASGPAMLRSADGGNTFEACAIPGRPEGGGAFDLEEFTGHNVPDGPPPFVRFTRTAKDAKVFWRSIHDLDLFLPAREGGRLTMDGPVTVSRNCIGLAAHSGIPSSVVSRGDKVHVVWGEATDPQSPGPGVPAFVATYDRAARRLGTPAPVGCGAPPNDIHNSPSIAMDGGGGLHALAGTHGRPFPYAASVEPNDAGGGWTLTAPKGDEPGQTYIGMVCGPDGTLHAAFRMWRRGIEPFPASIHATLACQRKRPGQPWEAPRVLVVPPFSEYSVFYHRLTIDRKGRLFLSYDCWSTHWFYRNDLPGRRRTMLMSSDGGETWKLAQLEDLLQAVGGDTPAAAGLPNLGNRPAGAATPARGQREG